MKQRFTITVKHSRWVEEETVCPTGETLLRGYSVPLPDTTETVEVFVDVEKIAQQLGRKACRSTSGRSRAISGLVVVKHVRPSKA